MGSETIVLKLDYAVNKPCCKHGTLRGKVVSRLKGPKLIWFRSTTCLQMTSALWQLTKRRCYIKWPSIKLMAVNSVTVGVKPRCAGRREHSRESHCTVRAFCCTRWQQNSDCNFYNRKWDCNLHVINYADCLRLSREFNCPLFWTLHV